MDQALTRGSRLLAIGGVASVLFGVGALVWPGITLAVLVALFGAFVLVVGGLTLVYALEMASQHIGHWVPMAVSGVFGIAIGAFTFFRPGITALALLYTIAAWAILTGVLEIAAGVGFTGQVKGAWALWLGGLASVAFGFIIALQPASGLLTIVWLIGIYAIALGVTRMFYAYQIQRGQGCGQDRHQVFPGARSDDYPINPSLLRNEARSLPARRLASEGGVPNRKARRCQMETEKLSITQNVADDLILEQTVYDVTGEKVGTVDDIDRDTGWFKLQVNPLSDKDLYIPFNVVTNIDPKEVYLGATKEAIHREFSEPPTRTTQVQSVDGQEIATTRQASGYDGTPIIVDEVNVGKLRNGIGEGYAVLTSDDVSLGTIKRYDPVTGWILVGKTALTKYDLVVPVTVVSRIDRQFASVHLAVSGADLKAMKHLEPVDVVFVGMSPITAAK